jgi:hypothetical protein
MKASKGTTVAITAETARDRDGILSVSAGIDESASSTAETEESPR